MYQGKFEPGVQRNLSQKVHPAGTTQQNKTSQPQRTAGTASQQRTVSQQQRAAQTSRQVQPAPKKRGPRTGGIIFYTLYFLLIAVFAGGMFLGKRWLDNWLVAYEASQPTTKSQEIFDQYFADPDWGELYELSGAKDTPYEGREQYVAYMAEKVGGAELTYLETSAGTSGDKKYLVRLGEKSIASFTLSGETERITDIPDWKLGKVDLVFDRAEGYRIQKREGHTAYVNGAPLDESFTIQMATTKAEEYLPIGVSAGRTYIQEIDGLMVRPTVTINDQNGQPVDVIYDEVQGMFVETSVGGTIPDDVREQAIGAAESYGKLMIKAAQPRDLAKYYDTSGDAYKAIYDLWRKESTWFNSGSSYKLMNETVSEYCRYSDTLCSARVSLSVDVYRSDGSVKSYPIDTTFFFTMKNDKWMAYQMTNEEVQIPIGQVRLIFMNGEKVLDKGFYDTDSKELLTPLVAAPEGKVFAGWVRESVNENGRKQLDLVFTPDETGHATIPSGTTLEPMTLYPYFEDAAAPTEGGEA